jgi:quinol monooxygenase YgiN
MVLNYFNNRSTNTSAESFNSKIKKFRLQLRGVRDKSFFLLDCQNFLLNPQVLRFIHKNWVPYPLPYKNKPLNINIFKGFKVVPPGVEPQLQAHLSIGKNTGITDAQLLELTAIIEKTAGKTQANVLRNAIGQPVTPIIEPDMLVRISEIEIIPEYLEEYKSILEKESSESVKLESGVIAIYPMFQKLNPLQIRIIEIYANQKAYKSHLQTPHFQDYKTTTLKMVKSLKLVDMTALDPNTMPLIFDKIEK